MTFTCDIYTRSQGEIKSLVSGTAVVGILNNLAVGIFGKPEN